ncbi:MAG: maleylpyruvate isomerase family mycothiol-dependent enzyme [Actinomycetota bacterium]|nr:maleylpyruvate isomerase family mycothiol-dependent enzyme [Actinomycetota bacterium]
MSRPDRELSWVADGQALFEQTVMRLDDLRGQSRLPGWTRGHVVTHVARNAEGLERLLTWARTGIETPMYPSVQAREADIEAGACRAQPEQLDDLRRTGAAFAATAQELSPDQWDATVATRHGPMPAARVAWARVRELWLHLVDLDAGVEVDAIPADIATRLVREVAAWMHTRVTAAIQLQLPGGQLITFGPENTAAEPVAGPVSGPVPQLAGWLTGRPHGNALTAPGGLPDLPPWI